jgi:hypothetical protein
MGDLQEFVNGRPRTGDGWVMLSAMQRRRKEKNALVSVDARFAVSRSGRAENAIAQGKRMS